MKVIGIVAHNWLLIADQSTEGIFDEDCDRLVQLHSDAVDFPKTGTAVHISRVPRPMLARAKPDWDAPETLARGNSSKYYESNRAIGKLFRAVDLIALNEAQWGANRLRIKLEKGEESTVTEIKADLDEAPQWHRNLQNIVDQRVSRFIKLTDSRPNEVDEVSHIFNNYATQLRSICYSYSISRTNPLTEEEVVVGTIVGKTSHPRLRKDMMARLRDVTTVLVRDVGRQLRGEEDDLSETRLRRAWVAWKFAIAEHTMFGGESFWWITLRRVLDAVRACEDEEYEDED